VPVVAFNAEGQRRLFTVAKLLPASFAAEQLPLPPTARRSTSRSHTNPVPADSTGKRPRPTTSRQRPR